MVIARNYRKTARMSLDRKKLLEIHATAGVGVADIPTPVSSECPETA